MERIYIRTYSVFEALHKLVRTKSIRLCRLASYLDHRLYTPYGYETHKRHCLYAGFAPLCYIRRAFTENSSFQNFIHKIS